MRSDGDTAVTTSPVREGSESTTDLETPRDALLGTLVGKYRVLSVLGSGGMGVVYEAEDVETETTSRVAIKVLHPDREARSSVADRFVREIRALQSLQHPNIVRAIDVGTTDDGRPYVVIQRLYGETLQSRLDRSGALPLGEALAIARQIALALAAAHAAGIAHRDLKPSNVFLTTDNAHTVKVLDFGLAKRLDANDASSFSTRTGALLYMSPEQCHGRAAIDERADVYALGCVLYAMLVGRPPFYYTGAGVIIAAHLNEAPQSPRAAGAPIGEPLERLLLSMLAKQPDKRPQRMTDIAAMLADPALAAMLATPSAERAHMLASTMTAADLQLPSAKRSRRGFAIAAAGVVAAAGGFVAWKTVSTTQPPRALEAPWRGPDLVRSGAKVAFPEVAIDRNGAAVVVWREWLNDVPDIWLRRYDPLHGWQEPMLMENEPGEVKSGQVRMDPTGATLVTWRQQASDGLHLWARTWTAAAGWSSATRLDDGPGDADQRFVTLDGHGRGLAVFSKPKRILSRRLDFAHGFAPPEVVFEQTARVFSLHAALSANGTAFAMWRNEGEQAVHLTQQAAPPAAQEKLAWSEPHVERLYPGFGTFDLRLGADGSGRALAVFVDTAPAAGVLQPRLGLVRFAPATGWQLEWENVPSHASIGLLDLAVNDWGLAATVWQQADNVQDSSWLLLAQTSGGTFPVERLSDVPDEKALRPWVSLANDNSLVAIWRSGANALWARRRRADGGWDRSARLTERMLTNKIQYRVAVQGSQTMVTWDEVTKDEKSSEIWAARLAPQPP